MELLQAVRSIEASIVMLNLCVLHSKMGDHDKAILSVNNAIEYLLSILKSNGKANPDDSIDVISLLYTAYYKCGTEFDKIGHIKDALTLVERGKSIYKFLTQYSNCDSGFDLLCEEAIKKIKNHKAVCKIEDEIKSNIIYKSYVECNKPKIKKILSKNRLNLRGLERRNNAIDRASLSYKITAKLAPYQSANNAFTIPVSMRGSLAHSQKSTKSRPRYLIPILPKLPTKSHSVERHSNEDAFLTQCES